MTSVFMYSWNLVFIKFLRLDYCLLVAWLDLELSLFEARSRVEKVANEIIRADALADQQNGGVAIYFPSHLLWIFRQKNVIHLNSKVANEMIRADQYNGTAQAKCIFSKNGCFTRPLVHNASNWGSDGFLRVKNLKVLKISYFEIIEML